MHIQHAYRFHNCDMNENIIPLMGVNKMDMYWNQVWKNPDIEEYERYIYRHSKSRPEFLDVFKKYNIKYVCDSACGFGAYSAMLSANGYRVVGFDIAKSAIELAKKLLNKFEINTSEYIVSSITNISFKDEQFDAVVAHAVIDHLAYTDAIRAIEELFRIVKNKGLVYISFDGIEDDDMELEHIVLDDGSFLYSDKSRNGLLFKYYSDQDINTLLNGRNIIYSKTNMHGDREIVIQK